MGRASPSAVSSLLGEGDSAHPTHLAYTATQYTLSVSLKVSRPLSRVRSTHTPSLSLHDPALDCLMVAHTFLKYSALRRQRRRRASRARGSLSLSVGERARRQKVAESCEPSSLPRRRRRHSSDATRDESRLRRARPAPDARCACGVVWARVTSFTVYAAQAFGSSASRAVERVSETGGDLAGPHWAPPPFSPSR